MLNILFRFIASNDLPFCCKRIALFTRELDWFVEHCLQIYTTNDLAFCCQRTYYGKLIAPLNRELHGNRYRNLSLSWVSGPLCTATSFSVVDTSFSVGRCRRKPSAALVVVCIRVWLLLLMLLLLVCCGGYARQ